MAPRLSRVLAELLAEVPGADAICLERWDPPAGGGGEQVDSHFADLRGAFEAAVAEVASDWGRPSCRGSVEEAAFPGWSEALLLATWVRDGNTAFVALRQDDPEEPMFIELGALTHEEIETLELGRG